MNMQRAQANQELYCAKTIVSANALSVPNRPAIWICHAKAFTESRSQNSPSRRPLSESDLKSMESLWLLHFGMVAKGGIEPPTRGFSIRCSTN